MSSQSPQHRGVFRLTGPAEAPFLSRVLQVLQLRGCAIASIDCARQNDSFALSIAVDTADDGRFDVVAALLGRIVGVETLRWHVEARRD